MHRLLSRNSKDADISDEQDELVAGNRTNDSSEECTSSDENSESEHEYDTDYDERKLLSSAEFEANIPLDKLHDCVNFVYDKAVIPLVKSVFQTVNHGIDFFFTALSRHGKGRHEKK